MSFTRMFSPPKKVVVQIEANVLWEALYDAQKRIWIGVCNDLNLNATGDTWADLQACANDAMQLLFEDLSETGELTSYLKRMNWRISGPDNVTGTTPRFDVPTAWERKNRYEEMTAAHA